MFRDRADAARRLARYLSHYRDKPDVVVLGIPRGGVVTSAVLACELGLPCDVIFTKKIGHPLNREFAIGSVSLSSEILNEKLIRSEEIPRNYIRREIERIRKDLWKRYGMYRGAAAPASLRGKAVILCDDGVATGLTMSAAIKVLRAQSPKRIVIALPVCPAKTKERLAAEADEIVCLEEPDDFVAIGQHYEDFHPVDDDEVIELLKAAAVRS